MSCTICQSLNYSIKSPKELDNAIFMLDEFLKKDLITSIGYGNYSDSFDYLQKYGWRDYVSCYFKCNKCSQKYHLVAETYHGKGGQLQAIEEIEEAVNE